ncbi:MAG: trigger factor [Acidimicrobiia bacterium]|nr:trigger factor [Acidimicrobiia bacterium]
MQTQMTEAGPFERLLTLTLDESELDDAKTAAARKLSKDMKIKGFRPGKAPRAVVERMVGAEALRSEAIDEALPGAVTEALRDEELNPVTAPRVEDMRDLDGGGVQVDVRITMWPTVEEAPSFDGRKVEVELPEVENSEIDDQVDRLRGQFAELEDVERAADEGDFVMVNITALDGDNQIEDASADDLLYEVGSQSFLGGLDELVAGATAGDIRKGPGVLPPGFTDHTGEVTLSVLVKGVKGKKLPEVNDAWVSDITEFETVEELKDQLRDNLYAMKLSATGQQFRETLMDELIAELDIELPEALVDAEMENSFHNLSHSLESQGIDFGNYLRITGQDQEEFLAELRERSTASIKSRVLLDAVATSNEITVEEDELEGAIEGLAAQSGEDVIEVKKALAQSGQVVALAGDILRRKALNHILEQASPVNADGEPVDLTPPGYEEEAAAEHLDVDEAEADIEELDGAAAGSDADRENAAEQADEDSKNEADE